MPPSRTLPSLAPDPKRQPRGTPERELRGPITPDQIKDAEDVRLQNEAAKVLARAGYDVEHRHGKPITAAETARNPRLKIGKKPDYTIEREVFDCLAPRADTSPRNVASRILNEKVSRGQATRIILNLDRSRRPLDKWRAQFERHEIEGLEEIIVVKDEKVLPLFPSE